MLPRMAAKLRIVIVGAGNLGYSLAVSLKHAGYAIEAVIVRSRGASEKNARKLAKKVGAHLYVRAPPNLQADVIWFCVPDSEIQRAATALSGKISWKKKVALHSSGALSSDELSVLRKRGASVASAHPMMTFVRHAQLQQSQPSLAGVSFAIEGDRTAVRAVRQIVHCLGGESFPISKSDKAAYHAWATFASPLFTALLATNERVAKLAGIDRKLAKRRILPILRQTLENYAALDAGKAFSGPIIRGDIETIKKHLRVLSKNPVAREVYLALARAALHYLPAKNRKNLTHVLRD
jgi:predicted short-subunit dehydrogenase-like oxidoreductase (DUF2520 family)